MKKKRRQRVMSILMALLMIVGLVPTDFAVTAAKAATTKYIIDTTKDLTAMAQGDATDGQELKAGTDSFFTLVMSTKTKIDSSSKSFEDAYDATQRINFGGVASVDKNALKFTTDGAASVKIWWVEGGDDNRQIAILNGAGEQIAVTTDTLVKNATCISTLQLPSAGTYYLGGSPSNNYLFKVEVEVETKPVERVSVIDTTKDLTAMAQGDATDGQELKAGTDNFFTLVMSTKTKIDSSSKSFEDAYDATQRINFGGVVSVDKNALKFTTEGTASVKIWWVEGGDDNRQIAILNGAGEQVAVTTDTLVKNAVCISTLNLPTAGTYYLGSNPSNNYIFKVQVTETLGGGGTKPARKDWTEVSAPQIDTITSADGIITVPFTMAVGYDGADKVIVTMKDKNNTVIESKNSSKEGTNASVTFTPTASGEYIFSISAIRDGETDKVGTDVTYSGFVLPLGIPSINSATSDGKGGAALTWDAVKEADSYTISYKKSADTAYTVAAAGITVLNYTVTGLTLDTQYSFVVTAVRNNPSDKKDSLAFDKKITATAERVWKTGYVGSQASDNKTNGKVTVNTEDGSVYMNAPAGKFGSSNDGYEFYYTEVDASKENFTLSATFKITAIGDNQSGVGLLVADTLGTEGNFELASETNYLLAGVAKTEWTTDGVKTTNSCGTGVRKVTGCTDPTGQDAAGRVVDISKAFQENLDTTQVITADNLKAKTCQDTYTVTLTKDNNSYYATMVGSDNVIHMYDPSKLLKQDGDKVYVGLAVSRKAEATFSGITFETRDPASDPAKDESTWEKDYTPQNLFVYAGSSTGTSDYTYRYYGNWAGQFDLTDGAGNVLVSKYIEAGETVVYDMQLAKGTTKLITTITPDPNKVVLKSYDPVVIEKTVTYKTYGNEGQTIVVSADAVSGGKGTDASPMDIYSAIKYAQPGQVIYLKNGTYNLTSPVTIPFSVSGTADKMITLMAEEAGQVILDGSQIPEASGSILNVYGNYWKVYGLDICNSSKNTKGVGVAGNNNIIEMCNIHDNGTTGLQISRSGGEPKEWWPANNLVKNCTAYNNCDPLLNDADGFAAKLTVGEGNKFYGCIAYSNIDDGWDLYAKNEVGQGPIGAVVIENSVAYNNGYIEGVGYGEGNGFKLGGEGLPGAHQLINCVSYNNGGKGITSNNGPDCQVINCTSYNNNYYYGTGAVTKTSASPNIGLAPLNGTKYTGTTNYVLKNTISIYTLANGTVEQLTVKGQDALESENNYLVNSAFKSLNSKGAEATVDWFVSTDTSVIPTREANGTINMHGLLEIKAAYASLGVGATIVTSGDAVSLSPVKTTVITPQTGDVTHIYLFITLSIMSGAALVGLYYFDKKKKAIVKR